MVATRTVKTVQQFVDTEPDGAVLYVHNTPREDPGVQADVPNEQAHASGEKVEFQGTNESKLGQISLGMVGRGGRHAGDGGAEMQTRKTCKSLVPNKLIISAEY